jgi:hypothetical protein
VFLYRPQAVTKSISTQQTKSRYATAIRALVSAVIPPGSIVFGGHPAITPMIRLLVLNKGLSIAKHIFLFQSRYFQEHFPPEVREFENLFLVEAVRDDRESSLRLMREKMIGSQDFAAGIFIGGLEGVEEEYDMESAHGG